MNRTHFTLLLLLLASPGSLAARVELLLVPPPDTAPTEARPELILYLNNPSEFDELFRFDAEIFAEIADASGHSRIRLNLVDPAQRQLAVPKMSRRTVRIRPAADLTGRGEFISLRLHSPVTNVIMLRPIPPPTLPGAPTPPVAAETVTRPGLGRRHIELTTDLESMRRHIFGYDPIYFAVGSRERLNARFQFSFKYRMVDPNPGAEEENQWRALIAMAHFAYTQTSIWDLESFSKPFYDSSYKPTIFLLYPFRRMAGSDWSFALQGGMQHESNGKGGGAAPVPSSNSLISITNQVRHPFDSRSLNTLYVVPRVRWEDAEGRFFEGTARLNAYFQIDENPDIARYRGYGELNVRGGYVRGLQLSAQVRGRVNGHGSLEFNLTWPTSETPALRHFPLINTLGGYGQIQYFNGYGESLLDYDVRRKDQLRFGLMIVR